MIISLRVRNNGKSRLSACLNIRFGFAPAMSCGNLPAKNNLGDGMNNSTEATGYLEDFRARGEAIADACTRCGACFEACPMTTPAGLGDADAAETAAGIVDLITGGTGNAEAVRWASVCSGSGNCIPACPEGINARFMVQLARGFARAQAGDTPLNTRWRQGFQTMSRGVRILSRLQLPPETLARVRGQSEAPRQNPPDVVFYTGCNILRLQYPEDHAQS
jgi:heterodisulfide reductase subunit D